MNRLNVTVGVLFLVLGIALGNFMSNRGASAQEMPPQQNDWVITPAKERAGFDAYIFNTRTGEAFKVEEASKTQVKLKP